MSLKAEMLEDFYGAQAKYDLIKTQNSQVINEQKNLLKLYI